MIALYVIWIETLDKLRQFNLLEKGILWTIKLSRLDLNGVVFDESTILSDESLWTPHTRYAPFY